MLDTSITSACIESLRREEDHQAQMILELAANLTGTSLALITLRDGDQLKRWLSLDDNTPDIVPIHDSLCGMAVVQGARLVTLDASQHPTLRDTCSVQGDGIRYYIGLPLRNTLGDVIGCMSMFDTSPRETPPSDGTLSQLDKLAMMIGEAVKRLMQGTRLNTALQDSQTRANWILCSISDGIIEWQAGHERLTISSRLETQLGYAPGTLDSRLEALHERVAPEMREEFQALIKDNRLKSTPFSIELRIRTRLGDYRWFKFRAQFDVRDNEPRHFIGSLLDIHHQHLANVAQANKLRRYEHQQAALIRLGNTRHIDGIDIETLEPWICQLVAEGLQVRKVSLWRMNEQNNSLHLLHVRDSSLPSPHDDTADAYPKTLPHDQHQGYFSALDSERVLAIADVSRVNEDLLFQGTFSNDIKAILDSPVRMSGKIVGVICCTECNAPREWADDELAFLTSVCDRVSQLATECERHITQQRLSASERRYRATFEHSAVGMAHLGNNGQLLRINQRIEDILGYPTATLSRCYLRELVDPEDLDHLLEQHQALINGEKEYFTQRCRFIHASGNTVHADISISAIDPTPNQEGYTLIALIDNTLNHTMSQRLIHEANHDSLTGLLNRAAFRSRLTQLCDNARADDTVHCLAYIDLDQFKVVNDTCGHSAGDALLIQLVDIIRAELRPQDFLARLGGDEFGLLMPETMLEVAEQQLEHLRNTVANFRFMWDDKLFGVSSSIGLVSISSRHNDPHQLLSAADAACYEAKDAGRNRVHRHCESGDQVTLRMQEKHWVTEITAALEEQRIVLFQQPIVSTHVGCESDSELHYEVLVRLRSRDGSIISPGEFLPAAERYGLSAAIDEHVIRAYLSWLASQKSHAERLTMVALNLSGHSISSPSFRETLVTLVRESGIPGNKICFEITETVAITRLRDARTFFETLGELGCYFALDDFGSGVSSFGYLKSLPVDYLKIDGAFIRDMDTNRVSYSIARAIAEVAREMGMKTVAEFVGSKDVLASVSTIGVDHVQGYAIGMPRPLMETSLASPMLEHH